jgi:G3E family GTPase
VAPVRPNAVPLTVLGGYLGAGKTTVVNSLLRRAGGRRLGILVNDFGEVSVDAQILRASSDGVVELAGGCVCCDLSLGMGPALAQLVSLDPRPDQVLVEVSGVGEPAAVAAWARTPGFRPDGVVVVVPLDRIRALARDRWVADLVASQIDQADLLVCTRGDLVGPAEREAVTGWLQERSPAPQVDAPNGEVPLEVIFGIGPPRGADAPEERADSGAGAESGGDAATGDGLPGRLPPVHGVEASSFVRGSTWTSDEATDVPALASRFGALPGLLRAKGFVRPAAGRSEGPAQRGGAVLVQAVGRRVECTTWEPEADVAAPAASVVTVLTTPDVDDAALAAALPGWRRVDAR